MKFIQTNDEVDCYVFESDLFIVVGFLRKSEHERVTFLKNLSVCRRSELLFTLPSENYDDPMTFAKDFVKIVAKSLPDLGVTGKITKTKRSVSVSLHEAQLLKLGLIATYDTFIKDRKKAEESFAKVAIKNEELN